MQGSIHSETVGAHRPLRIAMVAPPWISIPAPTYGGIEEVVRLLCQGLVAQGHQVTLFAAPDSESDAGVVEVLDEPQPDQIEHSLIEAAHVGSVFDRIDRERLHGPVSMSCTITARRWLWRWRIACREPFVHTLHGPFDDERTELYRRQGHKATLVAISDSQRSQAPDGVDCRHVVPNPIDLDEWPFQDEKDGRAAVPGQDRSRQGAASRRRGGAEGGPATGAGGPGAAGRRGVLRQPGGATPR